MEFDVVMLPTKKHDFNGLWKDKNHHLYYGMSLSEFQPQHLYFISDDDIKEGDYVYESYSMTISQYVRRTGDAIPQMHFKVVAATDPSLSLPSIPEEWIRTKYVPSNGAIKKVLLEWEYETMIHQFRDNNGAIYGRGGIDIIKNQLRLTPNNEVIVINSFVQLEQYPEKHRPITASFSPYCIGQDRDQYKQKKCQCSRCLTHRGEVPDEYTELISHIHSCINKYELHESTSKIIAKDKQQKVQYALGDLKDLIQHLQWIIEPPTL